MVFELDRFFFLPFVGKNNRVYEICPVMETSQPRCVRVVQFVDLGKRPDFMIKGKKALFDGLAH